MRYFILSLIFVLGLSGGAKADEAALRAVISSQIEAFLAEDVDRAYSFASPFIQRKFGTPETFGTMVREGYPMVWRPSDVTFLDAEVIAGKLWQSVMVRGPAGKAWIVDYEMVELEDGWKINGVQVRAAPEVAA
ncbi:hypothetical protein ROTO_21640 [Roseovarius tolerans]|uniref:DUF4864 domain-containing protein n=1 Tax=Roseovarius tolerans TaxID=74031 RepID=A0A0L6CUD9_9RHOB|nr:DUF4864 domain-containing protein [Roseovarius tolerans]KNX41300.1 hypothetical protein ROTO_21640 [Roseovarius tolerans]SEM54063.1 protein of unknown function [Roseovarius tolerans]